MLYLQSVINVLMIYLVFGVIYSTYRLKKEYKRSYFMLRYTNVKHPAGSMIIRYAINVITWLPRLILEVMDA